MAMRIKAASSFQLPAASQNSGTPPANELHPNSATPETPRPAATFEPARARIPIWESRLKLEAGSWKLEAFS
jgi:hypothetical protein